MNNNNQQIDDMPTLVDPDDYDDMPDLVDPDDYDDMPALVVPNGMPTLIFGISHTQLLNPHTSSTPIDYRYLHASLTPIDCQELNMLIENGEVCSICLEQFKKNDEDEDEDEDGYENENEDDMPELVESDVNYVCKLNCSHGFHSNCVREWFRTVHTCPLCRVCA